MKHSGKNLNAETLRIWWSHTRIYWPWLILCGIGVLGLICCDVGLPIMYKKLTDLLVSLGTDLIHRSQSKPPRKIWMVLALIVSVNLGKWLGWRFCGYGMVRFETHVMEDLGNTCFKYLHNHSYRFFSDNFAGSLLKRANRFSMAFEIIADQFVLQLGPILLRVVLILGVLFWRNTNLGLVFLSWTLLFGIGNIFVGRSKLKYDLHRAEMDTKITGQLADTISNNATIKLFAGAEREGLAFADLTRKLREARYKSWMFAEYSNSVQGFSTRILELVVLVMAIDYWWQGVLTIGDFVLLISYLRELIDKVQEIGKCVQRIYEAMADANEMTEILLTKHEIRDIEAAPDLQIYTGQITFKNLGFRYSDNANLVFNDLNLQTKPGERIGIVGSSGAGKSTVLKLLVRLYNVTSGAILIDNQDIAQVTQDSLHRNIAYVPQDPLLFHRTLMENIRYSRPRATDEEVFRAAKLAHCHEFISGFPLGYSTFVGERGVKLSGGERQRIAIARAILMDAPILVLDEATSSLDSESEAYIQDALDVLMAGRTVLAVAHRLSTIHKMDRIIVIENSQISEEGDHNLLLQIEGGTYNKLWSLQTSI